MNIHHLPFAVADGAHNMAADETLLLAAESGRASLRFYGWSEATLSLGYFQPGRIVRADPRLATLPFVRRPTGGAALVHHHELTYALALPEVLRIPSDGNAPRSWMVEMHCIIARALADFGLEFQQASSPSIQTEASSLCFMQPTPGDLLREGHKLLGSAQRKHHHALLQHGSLLLAQSPFAPSLPGIQELTGAALAIEPLIAGILWAFQDRTGLSVVPAPWSPVEQNCIDKLVAGKYGRKQWNEKR